MPTLNLPLQATLFVGRTDELARLAALLADPDCRLLTLVGPGGIGKTRLAIQAADKAHFANGVFFVSLTPISSSELIASTVASTLQVSFHSSDEPRLQIIQYLREKQMLLVMDNFEHLLAGVNFLSDVLQMAPGVKFLVTSRERLNLQEEWVLTLDGLSFRKDGAADPLESYSAVQLFVQRARQVQANFSLRENAQAVQAICQHVEGMPLGLELAASWLRAMPCSLIAAQIRSNLDYLTTPIRNIPERHRSMRAVFDHSWHLLSDEEQTILRKFSVFHGGCTAEAAARVAQASHETLAALVDKSLLRFGATGRYDLHELVRQYAEERLNASVEESIQVRDLHCRYYAEYISGRKDALVHGNPRLAAAEIDAELENVRSAWNRIIERANAELVEKALIALNGFYLIRGLYQEGAIVFRKTAERFHDQSNRAFALAVSHQAFCVQFLGDYKTAVELYQQGLAVFRRLGDATQTAFCLERLSEISRATKDYGAAQQYLEEAWNVIEEMDESERWRQAFILPLFGHLAFLTNDLVEAKQWYEKALAMSQIYDVQLGLMNASYFLGNVELAMGAYTKAEQAYQACLKRAQDIDNETGCVDAFAGLGEASLRRRAYVEAKQYCRDALQLAKHRLLVNPPIMRVLVNIAELFIESKQYEWAAALVAVSLHHPVSEEVIEERARSLLPALEAGLQPHVLAAAWERGTKMEVNLLMGELLDELGKPAVFPATRVMPPLDVALSPRELEILQLVAEGYSNQEIADQLYVGVSTVKKHINHIYNKLDVRSRTQAVARARERRFLL